MRHTQGDPGWAVRGGYTVSSAPTPSCLLGGLWSPNKPQWVRSGPWTCCTHSPHVLPGSTPGEQGHPYTAATLASGLQDQDSCPVAPASAAHLGPSLASSLLRPGASGASSPQWASARSLSFFSLLLLLQVIVPSE